MKNREHFEGRTPRTREEEADQALRHTVVTPAVAWGLVLFFGCTIFLVPVVQQGTEIRLHLANRPADPPGKTAAVSRLLPPYKEVFRFLTGFQKFQAIRTPGDVWRCLPRPQQIRDYENALEEASVVSAWIRPRLQYLLTGLLGAGNEQAYCGRDGWLMYRPEVDYLTGPGFLDPATLRRRAMEGKDGAPPVQPDPVKAIVQFHRQLSERGIVLVVLPVPVKPMIHPEKLSGRYTGPPEPLQNPSYSRFQEALRHTGVLLCDLAPGLAEARRCTGQPQYLEADTHWTPLAMEWAAQELARFIQMHVPLPQRPLVSYVRRAVEVDNLGDIAVMLQLPPNQRLFRRQRVRVVQIRTPTGEPWQPQGDAEILLLGDSFSNIYSLPGMGWGESAGFAEHLSAALHRPLDCIALNAGGSYAARQRLFQELARGRDRLAGKRLVIYEFAMRDLLVGDWKLLDLPHPRTRKVQCAQ